MSTEVSETNKPTKASFLIALCATFAILANQVEEGWLKQVAIIFSSPCAFGVNALFTSAVKEYNHYRFKKLIEGFITTLKAERAEGVSISRRKEIENEIKSHRKVLQEKQMKMFKID